MRALGAAQVALLLLSTGAAAQQPCGPRERLIVYLPNMYSEHVIAWGMDETGRLIEFWRSQGGSWTLLVTVDGRSCIVASGAKSEEHGGRGI